MPEIIGAAHIALTVRDMERSADWYQEVFEWQLSRGGPRQPGTPRLRLYDPASSFSISLCQPEDGSDDLFDYRRTGLDHLAFKVDSEVEFQRWIDHLDAIQVTHSPVREVGDKAKFVSFDDPDGIQLEICLYTNEGA